MKYKPEDIKPKRYPKYKPSATGYRWVFTNEKLDVMRIFWEQCLSQHYRWDKIVTWFIDIPGAPPELKPLAYPENNPDIEAGDYWAHNKHEDRWYRATYMYWAWEQTIDYFIPYRLDEPVSDTDELEPFTDERLLLELINRNVLGEASSVTERCVPFNEVVVGIGNDEVAYITFPKEVFGALCDLVYEPLGNSEQLEREMKQSDKRTVEYTIELYSYWLDQQGYDVTKREPEILPCPNPECREKCNMDDEGYEEENEYYLHCEICGYCSPIAYNPEEAIRLHNLISGK